MGLGIGLGRFTYQTLTDQVPVRQVGGEPERREGLEEAQGGVRVVQDAAWLGLGLC